MTTGNKEELLLYLVSQNAEAIAQMSESVCELTASVRELTTRVGALERMQERDTVLVAELVEVRGELKSRPTFKQVLAASFSVAALVATVVIGTQGLLF